MYKLYKKNYLTMEEYFFFEIFAEFKSINNLRI